MSTQTICDNCDKVLDPDEEHLWIKVGWRILHPHEYDACSPQCARRLVNFLSREQRRIDRELAEEVA